MNKYTVYRMFAADGALLYVGQTYDIKRRLGHHKNYSPWIAQVAKIVCSRKYWWLDAILFERIVIFREQPLYNKAHKDGLPRLYKNYESCLPSLLKEYHKLYKSTV